MALLAFSVGTRSQAYVIVVSFLTRPSSCCACFGVYGQYFSLSINNRTFHVYTLHLPVLAIFVFKEEVSPTQPGSDVCFFKFENDTSITSNGPLQRGVYGLRVGVWCLLNEIAIVPLKFAYVNNTYLAGSAPGEVVSCAAITTGILVPLRRGRRRL